MISKKKIMLVHQEMVKEKNLILKRGRKNPIKETILEHLLILIIQNISVKNEQIIHQ